MYHGVAVLANGSVTNWGSGAQGEEVYCSVTNRTLVGAAPSNRRGRPAGDGQDLALLSNGTCVAWGAIGAYGTEVPTNLNLTNVSAVACGWAFNVGMSSNGTITAWGNDWPGITIRQMFPVILEKDERRRHCGGRL